MKTRLFLVLPLATALSLSACNNTAKRTDGTAGTAVTDLDSAEAKGGVKAAAVVIDNNAGATVTAKADSAGAAADSSKKK